MTNTSKYKKQQIKKFKMKMSFIEYLIKFRSELKWHRATQHKADKHNDLASKLANTMNKTETCVTFITNSSEPSPEMPVDASAEKLNENQGIDQKLNIKGGFVSC